MCSFLSSGRCSCAPAPPCHQATLRGHENGGRPTPHLCSPRANARLNRHSSRPVTMYFVMLSAVLLSLYIWSTHQLCGPHLPQRIWRQSSELPGKPLWCSEELQKHHLHVRKQAAVQPAHHVPVHSNQGGQFSVVDAQPYYYWWQSRFLHEGLHWQNFSRADLITGLCLFLWSCNNEDGCAKYAMKSP